MRKYSVEGKRRMTSLVIFANSKMDAKSIAVDLGLDSDDIIEWYE